MQQVIVYTTGKQESAVIQIYTSLRQYICYLENICENLSLFMEFAELQINNFLCLNFKKLYFQSRTDRELHTRGQEEMFQLHKDPIVSLNDSLKAALPWLKVICHALLRAATAQFSFQPVAPFTNMV